MNPIKESLTDLSNFDVTQIKHYQGCPDAMVYLHRKFRSATGNFYSTNFQNHLIGLCERNSKHLWVASFLFSLMTPSAIKAFFDSQFSSRLDRVSDLEYRKIINDRIGFSTIKPINHYKETIEETLFKLDIQSNQPLYCDVSSEFHLLEAISKENHRSRLSLNENHTPPSLLTLKSLIESDRWFSLKNNKNLKDHSLTLKLIEFIYSNLKKEGKLK